MQRLGEEAGVTARPRFCSYWRVVVSRWGLEGERLVRLQMYVAVLYVLASRPLCSIETESSCFEPQTNPAVTSTYAGSRSRNVEGFGRRGRTVRCSTQQIVASQLSSFTLFPIRRFAGYHNQASGAPHNDLQLDVRVGRLQQIAAETG